jgi:hypothetical protein
MKIYRYFQDERKAAYLSPTYRRFGQKVGRNELCPCYHLLNRTLQKGGWQAQRQGEHDLVDHRLELR